MNSEFAKRVAVNPVVLNPPPAPQPASSTILKNLKNVSGYLHSPLVCLTFDDGPDPVYTPAILDVLALHDLRASFFVLGEAAERFPHLVKRMLDEGHTVGNHTYSHRHPWMVSSRRAQDEVARGSESLRKITGESPRWLRPPHGRLRRAMLKQVQAENMTTVLWSHSLIDWGPMGPAAGLAPRMHDIQCGDIMRMHTIVDWGPMGTEAGIAQRMHDIKFGDIVLMHDGQREHNHPHLIVQQLPKLAEWLQQRGITTVTLDQVA